MNMSKKRTFEEIAAQEGEEAAIQAGIEADPDAFELGIIYQSGAYIPK